MKNLIFLFLLLTTVLVNSCKDKNNEPDEFQPSLDLEEYVIINVNGEERLFTIGDEIEVRKKIENDGTESIRIFFIPEPLTFTHFILKIYEPAIGDFTKEQVEINYLDYSATDEFPSKSLNCTFSDCEGEMNLTIHEFGDVDEKIIGEFSGIVTANEEISEFIGEFVVNIDQ